MASLRGRTATLHHSDMTASAIAAVINCASETGGPVSLRIFRHSMSATERFLGSWVTFLRCRTLFV